MNPFNLRGPEFLLFYFLLSCLVLVLLWCQKTLYTMKNSGVVKALATKVEKDPYLIACLRGGSEELIRVALVTLLERGLLKAEGNMLEAVDGAISKVRCPLDKAILGLYENVGVGKIALKDSVVLSEAYKIRERLSEIGIHDQKKSSHTFNSGFVAICFLWFVALIKIIVALSRGHFNIIFLVMMALIAAGAVKIVANKDMGARVLSEVRKRFTYFGNRPSPLQFNSKTGEFAFYAAVFGFAGLSLEIVSIVEPLDIIPLKPTATDSSWGSSCSSSCGSSCGSGCGGGCGGCG